MISYTNHTQKALFKRMVAPLETKHASFFSPRISRVILSSSFLTSTSFTPSFFFQQLEKDIFFFLQLLLQVIYPPITAHENVFLVMQPLFLFNFVSSLQTAVSSLFETTHHRLLFFLLSILSGWPRTTHLSAVFLSLSIVVLLAAQQQLILGLMKKEKRKRKNK